MSPRPYRLGQRRAATEATRARILAATRDILMSGEGPAVFSIDAIATQAGVARMTVYYQFGSRRGLLEALMDDLAARGGMSQLAEVFQRPDALDALSALINAFVHFWASDRTVMRRLRNFAALDPDFHQVRERDEWRRNHLRVLLQRVAEQHRGQVGESFDETIDILQTLTSFETFDTLASPMRSERETAAVLWRVTRAVLELDSQQAIPTAVAHRRQRAKPASRQT